MDTEENICTKYSQQSFFFRYLRLSQFPWFGLLCSRFSSTPFPVFLHRSYILNFPHYHLSSIYFSLPRKRGGAKSSFLLKPLPALLSWHRAVGAPGEIMVWFQISVRARWQLSKSPKMTKCILTLGENLNIRTQHPMLYGLGGINSD